MHKKEEREGGGREGGREGGTEGGGREEIYFTRAVSCSKSSSAPATIQICHVIRDEVHVSCNKGERGEEGREEREGGEGGREEREGGRREEREDE